ncbi:cobalt-precorrin-6A reductase [Streptomyces gobiensis]|uniref:cobalt-precorrin-6A reductase n=1 Tax=Streptomyces gobiensis TaxID=2875706 RepID=UPI001E60C79E|nr:cobalt-precorrin-6A reductase [Streptomyces gobiensis]UGY95139.1 cobalt-precorrin-6A reductase [Streptomyces gobiensis]
MAHVLVLGGTAEARRLAGELAGLPGVRTTTSLAGRVARPRMPVGEVRIGGFGGAAGLADWLGAQGVTAVVDATHPFAGTISAGAAEAAGLTGVPLIALRRSGWTAGPGDRWLPVDSLAGAAALLPSLGGRVFLSTGRLGLAAFADLDELWFLVRTVDRPRPPLPRQAEILLERGPFSVPDERELLLRHRIEVLVTKDSGGDATAGKLVAARELGLPVVMVRRPPPPAGVTTVPDIAGVVRWLSGLPGFPGFPGSAGSFEADKCP